MLPRCAIRPGEEAIGFGDCMARIEDLNERSIRQTANRSVIVEFCEHATPFRHHSSRLQGLELAGGAGVRSIRRPASYFFTRGWFGGLKRWLAPVLLVAL